MRTLPTLETWKKDHSNLHAFYRFSKDHALDHIDTLIENFDKGNDRVKTAVKIYELAKKFKEHCDKEKLPFSSTTKIAIDLLLEGSSSFLKFISGRDQKPDELVAQLKIEIETDPTYCFHVLPDHLARPQKQQTVSNFTPDAIKKERVKRFKKNFIKHIQAFSHKEQKESKGQKQNLISITDSRRLNEEVKPFIFFNYQRSLTTALNRLKSNDTQNQDAENFKLDITQRMYANKSNSKDYITDLNSPPSLTHTHYFDQAEREKHQLVIHQGKFYILSVDSGYHEFIPACSKQHTAQGKRGWSYFIIDPKGNMYFSNETPQLKHSSFTQGSWVLFAGECQLADGILIGLTDHSGHYQPQPQHLRNALRFLFKNNVDLSHCFVYHHNDNMHKLAGQTHILINELDPKAIKINSAIWGNFLTSLFLRDCLHAYNVLFEIKRPIQLADWEAIDRIKAEDSELQLHCRFLIYYFSIQREKKSEEIKIFFKTKKNAWNLFSTKKESEISLNVLSSYESIQSPCTALLFLYFYSYIFNNRQLLDYLEQLTDISNFFDKSRGESKLEEKLKTYQLLSILDPQSDKLIRLLWTHYARNESSKKCGIGMLSLYSFGSVNDNSYINRIIVNFLENKLIINDEQTVTTKDIIPLNELGNFFRSSFAANVSQLTLEPIQNLTTYNHYLEYKRKKLNQAELLVGSEKKDPQVFASFSSSLELLPNFQQKLLDSFAIEKIIMFTKIQFYIHYKLELKSEKLSIKFTKGDDKALNILLIFSISLDWTLTICSRINFESNEELKLTVLYIDMQNTFASQPLTQIREGSKEEEKTYSLT